MLAARAEFAFLLALFPVLNWRLTAPRERGRAWRFGPAALALAWYGLSAAYSFGLYGVAFPHLAGAGPAAEDLLGALPKRLPAYLRSTLLPGVLALLTPEAFAAALPFVAVAGDVPWPKLPQDHLQHLSPALAATLWAFTSTLLRLAPRWARDPRRRAVWVAGLLAAAVLSGAHFAWVVVDRRRRALRSSRARRRPASSRRNRPRFAAPRGALQRSHARLVAVADAVATEREEWLDALVERSGRFAPPVAAAGAHVFVVRSDARFEGDPDAALERALAWHALPPRRRRWLRLRPGATR